MIWKKAFVFITLLSIFHFSCEKSIENDGYISEGIIEYNISYPQIPEDDLLLEILPKKMKMSFKNDSYRNDIVAGMGLFRTSIISKKDDDNLLHTVKILNNKFASTLNTSDLQTINPNFHSIDIEFTENTKVIAGFNCKEAKITVHAVLSVIRLQVPGFYKQSG